MPWPVTHILVAEIYYTPFFSHLNHKKFLIGTCFPDIRYPAKLPRKSTHIKHLSLREIQSQPAFHAGLLFHSYVDEMWNACVLYNNGHLFGEIPHDQPMIHAMKILQDKILYGYQADWAHIAAYFGDTLPEEQAYGAGEEMIRRWHDLLSKYLNKPPGINDLDMLSISLSPDLVEKIGAYFLAYEDNMTLNIVLRDFYLQANHICQETKLSTTPVA